MIPRRLSASPLALYGFLLAGALWLLLAPGRGRATPGGKKLALLIGVSEYQDGRLQDLPFCERDVAELAGVLDTYEVETLTGPAAMARPVLKSLQQASVRASPGDTLLVFWSGHGLLDQGRYYLVPADFDSSLPVRNAAVDFETIRDLVASSDARQKLFIVDTCYAGMAGGGSMAVANQEIPDQVLEGWEGTLIMTSCRPRELSWVDERSGMSLFAKHLASALSGKADGWGGGSRDGWLTFHEVYSYTYERTKGEALAERGQSQRPRWKATNVEGTLVLAPARRPGEPAPGLGSEGADPVADGAVPPPAAPVRDTARPAESGSGGPPEPEVSPARRRIHELLRRAHPGDPAGAGRTAPGPGDAPPPRTRSMFEAARPGPEFTGAWQVTSSYDHSRTNLTIHRVDPEGTFEGEADIPGTSKTAAVRGRLAGTSITFVAEWQDRIAIVKLKSLLRGEGTLVRDPAGHPSFRGTVTLEKSPVLGLLPRNTWSIEAWKLP